MKAYLAVFLGYRDSEIIRENLAEFDSVKELDDYTKMFENSNGVKRKFQTEIQEFILDNRKNKKYRETKDGKPIVYVSTYTINDKNGLRFIVPFYKNRKDITVLTIDELILKMVFIIERIKNYNYEVKNRLSSDDIKEYLRALGFFRIQFTGEELDYLRKYISGRDDELLRKMMTIFKRRLKKMDENKLYGLLRFNAVDLKKHHLSILETYNVYRHLEDEEVSKDKKERLVSDCNDEYFENLVNKENYEELFSKYDLDEIIRYSSDNDNPLGVRRK